MSGKRDEIGSVEVMAVVGVAGKELNEEICLGGLFGGFWWLL